MIERKKSAELASCESQGSVAQEKEFTEAYLVDIIVYSDDIDIEIPKKSKPHSGGLGRSLDELRKPEAKKREVKMELSSS